MPTTRRSTGGARARPGPARGQSTISFSHRVSKPVPKDLKKAVLTSAAERADLAKPTKKEEEIDEILTDEPATPEIEETEVKEEVPEKSEAIIRAEKTSDAQINKYWKSIEAQRLAARVHQQDMTLAEKVLRYFDVSSQYGVSEYCCVYHSFEADTLSSRVLGCSA